MIRRNAPRFVLRSTGILAACVFAVVGAADAGEPPKPGVSLHRTPGEQRIQVVLPGKLVDVSTPRRKGGREIWFLVRPEEYREKDEETGKAEKVGKVEEADLLPPCPVEDPVRKPLELYRLDRSGDGALEKRGAGLPWNTIQVEAADLNGDGLDELLLLVRGGSDPISREAEGLYRWLEEESGTGLNWVKVLEESNLVWPVSRGAVLAAQRLGSLRLYRFDSALGVYALQTEIPMPMDATVSSRWITVTARRVEPLGAGDGGIGRFAALPRPFGKTRLQTILVEPDRPEEDRVVESWSFLPEPEDLMESFRLLLDGEPALLVTTKEAGRLGLFAEKRVRLYRLRKDRSRAGLPPVLATVSNMNLWQDAHGWILDVNGDGRDDLAIGYWKGLKNSRAVLEVYLREADGGFGKPKTTAFDVKDGDRSLFEYGRDLNGNGRPDLLLADDDGLLLYPGLAFSPGRRLVAGKPERSFRLTRWAADHGITLAVGPGGAFANRVSSGGGAVHFQDIDDDGTPEILWTESGSKKEPGGFACFWAGAAKRSTGG